MWRLLQNPEPRKENQSDWLQLCEESSFTIAIFSFLYRDELFNISEGSDISLEDEKNY